MSNTKSFTKNVGSGGGLHKSVQGIPTAIAKREPVERKRELACSDAMLEGKYSQLCEVAPMIIETECYVTP